MASATRAPRPTRRRPRVPREPQTGAPLALLEARVSAARAGAPPRGRCCPVAAAAAAAAATAAARCGRGGIAPGGGPVALRRAAGGGAAAVGHPEAARSPAGGGGSPPPWPPRSSRGRPDAAWTQGVSIRCEGPLELAVPSTPPWHAGVRRRLGASRDVTIRHGDRVGVEVTPRLEIRAAVRDQSSSGLRDGHRDQSGEAGLQRCVSSRPPPRASTTTPPRPDPPWHHAPCPRAPRQHVAHARREESLLSMWRGSTVAACYQAAP